MADPICRWRNPSIGNVKSLISILPKVELCKDEARESVKLKNSGFYKTPYQLACQLGLYYEAKGRYFPKFSSIPEDEDLIRYLTNWIIRYSVPNPYTRGFSNMQPISVHSEICKRLLKKRDSLEWADICHGIFQETIGNEDILSNSINTYSPVIQIRDGMVLLRRGVTYKDLTIYIDIDISNNRNDKEYFFDNFTVADRRRSFDYTMAEYARARADGDKDLTALRQIQSDPDLSQTEKLRLAEARIGQGLFRRNLINECGICALTGVDDARLLIASHIKPWRDSNNQERLDAKNGLLLIPTYDKLFDQKLISFDNDKRMLVSPSLSKVICKKLNLVHNRLYSNLPLGGRQEYMDYHREKFGVAHG